MKKFKSLMLAALASAALAAPSFAEGHGNGIAAVTGQFQASMTYSRVSVDDTDAVTKQNTAPGVNTINFAGDNYDFFWEEDGGSSVKLKVHDTITSGDNSVSGYAEFASPFSGPTIGDVYIKGANKTFSLQVGKFGTSNAYSNGLGETRAKVTIGADDSVFGKYEENLDIPGFRGLQANISAGDVGIEVAVPWMNEQVADASVLLLKDKAGNAVDTNITGIRPKVTLGLGAVNVTALVYSLSFSPEDGAVDPDEKTSSGFQLMGNVQAGAAKLELGYTSQEVKDQAGDATTPNVMNGAVTVALGGGSKVGASFDMVNDGVADAETTATRLSATYQTPFFVESVTLSVGIGTSTQKTDNDVSGVAGTASSAEAKWTYAF
jgi:hypothetical protein